MAFLTEAELEEALLSQLGSLGYERLSETKSGPDGPAPERDAFSDVLLMKRLRAAIARLNPDIPAEAREDALRKVVAAESQNAVAENRRLHQLLVEGVPVEFYAEDGTIRGDAVRLIDFDNLYENNWVAIGQFTVIEKGAQRRPDVVLFVNGLPLAVIELKNPGAETASVSSAYAQLQTYKAEIPSLFRTNAVMVASDGVKARVGSLTADEARFLRWRTTDGRETAPNAAPELEILIEGVFEKRRFLDLIRHFTVFQGAGEDAAKIVAGYHQFHAVKKAIACTLRAMPEAETSLRESPAVYGLPDARDHDPGDKRIGVIWHTQGSGKSLLMAFYAGQLIRQPELENPTIVVVTDRRDLDDQLFKTFADCRDLLRQTPEQADDREDLRDKLNSRASGGVIFTTIQKFSPLPGETAFPKLTDRRNVVVIADEAHRSQYGFRAQVQQKTGEIAYGFAKHLRDGLPNASFIGFTGTPIESSDVNTRAVFGDYIDVYDISRAVEDGATVPIYYESRLARIELPAEAQPKVDAEIEELTEDEAQDAQEKLKQKWATIEALVGSDKRLSLIAEDIVRHFEDRVAAMDGKAMIVCMSRRICVALYDKIVALRPEWHSDDDGKGLVKVVMTGSASDPVEWQRHIGGAARREMIAKRAKKPDDPLKLVIVRDMWLTGFDAPSMHTMYVDKPMRGHGLMQAIARVNRVFRDKPAGLVVDYIGLAQSLKKALSDYTEADRGQTGIDEADAVALMLEKHDVVTAMFHGFDFRSGLHGTPNQRLAALGAAIDWIQKKQHEWAERETTDEERKRAHRRFQDAVLALSKAFALAASSDEGRRIADEVGFFQAVRASLVKASGGDGFKAKDREFAIRQIIDQAVVSTEIVDILKAAGFESPDISILSDGFLAEVQQTERKNLALEALKKLLNDEIRSRSATRVVEARKFSERLQDAIARYHTNALSTVEMLQALIDLARDISAANQRGEEQGLTSEEVAFYDALAENESAVDVLGDDNLRVIAQELLNKLKANVTVDWAHRESARAKLRTLVKRILKRHGYPPDLQDAAVQKVVQQAEATLSFWSG